MPFWVALSSAAKGVPNALEYNCIHCGKNFIIAWSSCCIHAKCTWKDKMAAGFWKIQMVECCRSGCEKAFWIEKCFDQDAFTVEDKFPANMMLVTSWEMHYWHFGWIVWTVAHNLPLANWPQFRQPPQSLKWIEKWKQEKKMDKLKSEEQNRFYIPEHGSNLPGGLRPGVNACREGNLQRQR